MRHRGCACVAVALALAGPYVPAMAADGLVAEATQHGYTYKDELAEGGTASAPWWRHAGSTRFETSAAIARDGFERSEWVVVASGASFADALAAAALAGTRSCPIVITPATGLTDAVADEVARLGATRAYVVGGTATLTDAVVADLVDLGVDCERVGGTDRQATSVAVAEEALVRSGSDVVFVAAGASYQDALSAGPWAWAHGAPILLATGAGTLTDGELAFLREQGGIARVVLLGGEASVSEAVRDQLEAAGIAADVERVGGQDRYDTSRLVAAWEVAHGMDWDEPTVASGRSFPDALCGAAFAGSKGSPLLLADAAEAVTMDALAEHADSFEGGHILGGQASVAWTTCVAGLEVEPSPLVDYVNLSPNHSGEREHAIDTITPHYMDHAGTVEWCGELFAFHNREASSNYGIGTDGRIGLYVEEHNRSWCSSSTPNDERAITIECANVADSSLTEATWNSLVALCADICVRNGIEGLDYTGDTSGNLTMHKWFATDPPTTCPGPWLEARFGQLAHEVNAILGRE